jgi:hypothetical protein
MIEFVQCRTILAVVVGFRAGKFVGPDSDHDRRGGDVSPLRDRLLEIKRGELPRPAVTSRAETLLRETTLPDTPDRAKTISGCRRSRRVLFCGVAHPA